LFKIADTGNKFVWMYCNVCAWNYQTL